ncbi:MAG: DUF2062 domain-containing protein [Thermodesulfobacteriota bacterium]|nr:DUF2062 domain-containing protein [Thermodesulfobacteriota bacterium]
MALRRLNRGFFEKLVRTVRYFYLRLILLPDTPHRVSLGLAVGVFVGLTPTVPFQTILAVPISRLVRGSMIAAAIGVWITNPLTIPLFYPAFFFLGRALTPYGQAAQLSALNEGQNLLALGTDAALAGIFGGLVMGIILAPLTYLLAFKYVDRFQIRERARIRQRFGLSP